MVIHWEKNIVSERIGGRIARVECSHCGCEYFYELTRVGVGSATAYYGIGVAGASASAESQSKRNLGERLADEAELVPCPKCNWINDKLVAGFRRSQYRRLGILAAYVGFFGTIGSLIGAWIISVGPAADGALLPYFLFAGPTLFILLAVATVALRNWMRSRIQPNHDFPMAPKSLPGTPPALFRDESTGELRPANSNPQETPFTGGPIEFHFGRHQLPRVCCGCLTEDISEKGYFCQVTTTMKLEVPRCKDCKRTAKRVFWGLWLLTAAIGMLITGAVIASMKVEPGDFWPLMGLTSLFSFVIASAVASAATIPVRVTGGDESRGVVNLRFRSPAYGQLLWKHICHSNRSQS